MFDFSFVLYTWIIIIIIRGKGNCKVGFIKIHVSFKAKGVKQIEFILTPSVHLHLFHGRLG